MKEQNPIKKEFEQKQNELVKLLSQAAKLALEISVSEEECRNDKIGWVILPGCSEDIAYKFILRAGEAALNSSKMYDAKNMLNNLIETVKKLEKKNM